MKVEQIMRRDVATCGPQDSLNVVAGIMWDRDCGCVPVVDGGSVVGMITDRDVCMAAYTQGRPLGSIRVSSAMSKHVHACRSDESVMAAEQTLRLHRIRRLPVVDAEGRLVGILALNDIAREAAREHDPIVREVSPEGLTETFAEICEPRTPRRAGA
jgi:CBS domain-containing protein